MKAILQLTGVALLGLALTGCFSGGSSSSDDSDRTVEFTTFVTGEINNTADDRDPVAINDQEFSFNDQDNEQAFDELF